MIGKLLFHIISGIAGLFLAYKFVPGVYFSGPLQTFLITGVVLGVFNFLPKGIQGALLLAAFGMRTGTRLGGRHSAFALFASLARAWANVSFPLGLTK